MFKLISFAIPVYRNAGALTLSHQKIQRLFSSLGDRFDYEIVFVNDGSDDGSLEELLEIRKADPRVKVVSFTRNFGQMAAILAGFKEVTGDVVVNVSADLQDPIELVEHMLRAWEQGAEVVCCYRVDRDDPFSARVVSKIAYAIMRIAVPQIPSGGFDYFLMDRKVLEAFNEIDVRNRFLQGDVLWYGYKTQFIPYKRLKRTIGKSQYNLSKKLKNFMDSVLDSSYLPIRFMSLLGVVTAALGLLYGTTVVYSRLMHQTPFTGWAPIMILILLIGGVIMVMLGIIGEYIWRIYDEVRKKPNYVIDKKFV